VATNVSLAEMVTAVVPQEKHGIPGPIPAAYEN
jgi:hypothetical protein